ncbi:cellulose synthase/poly-beta-1,6-N-acetylglucosamine synthase-like glycosyltransferase [Curtobacterium sp. PvP017]|uniref:glycosyltransferase family 2 protein n=1 Tax=unclassified Curtobacterium TaxID=257496 RepID=UPI000DB4A3B5|nr:glycosyltransferase family 2 protein [Curtobacterium sp. JUb34]PZO56351.1 MAG: glycosyl transferase family 2 [Leifsonia xyli]ROR33508.1 hyaluronan synthase [Curtobacterium sp. JUb34]
MFTFILQIRQMVEGHPEFYLFAVYSAVIWLLWLVKVVISARYRPFTGTFVGTTSVVVPVVDEPLDLFRDVIGRMVEQRPGEIIVVINGARNEALEAVCDEFAPLVRWTHTPIPGKRNAVKVGTEMSNGDITVLVDSDTVWTPGALEELLKPFADESVGGVTTRQRILEPERSWITRWADWLENSRALYSMPAQSVLGQIGCLPGRTIAFRRNILVRVMDKFMHEKFMGVFLEVSDDRTLTNLTLKEGYRTVYQYTSLVYTDAPLQVKKLFKQQLRWARGSQYNTLRMLPWMLGHAPVLAAFFITDIILPFMLFGVIAGWVYRAFTGQGENLYQGILSQYGFSTGFVYVAALMVVSSVLSMAIRQMRHLAEKPSDFFRLPMFIIVSTFFLMPIRLIGFFRLAHASGWGTRAGAYAGGPMQEDPAESVQPTTPGTQIPFSPIDAADRAQALDGFVQLQGTPSGAAHEQVAVDRAFDELFGADATTNSTATVLATRREAAAAFADQQPAAPRTAPVKARRYNPYAAIPYCIGFAIFALEAFLIV